MSIIQTILAYLVTLIVFLILDSIWLGLIAPKLYKRYIGHLMAKRPNFLAAGIFYILFVAGLMVFVLAPALSVGSVSYAALFGALYGFFTYVTFDITSQAIFKNWPTAITLIDITWGSLLSFGVSIVSYAIVSGIIK